MHCSFIDGARARHACVTWRPWAACLRSRACGPLAAPSCPATRRSAPPPCSHSMTHTCVRDGYVVIKGTRAGAGTGGSIGARCAACARVAKPQTAKPHRRGKVLARASSLRERSEGSGQQAMLCAALGSGEVHTAARTHLSAVISASLQSTCGAWRRGGVGGRGSVRTSCTPRYRRNHASDAWAPGLVAILTPATPCVPCAYGRWQRGGWLAAARTHARMHAPWR